MRNVSSVLLAGFVALFGASSAQAAMCDGSFGFAPFNISGMGTWAGTSLSSATSITFSTTEIVNATPVRDFASGSTQIPLSSGVTMATLPMVTADGTPRADAVTDFIVFASTGFSSATTPANRYHFDLATLTASWSGNSLSLLGTGTFRDTGGTFDDTPASFSMSSTQFLDGGSHTISGSSNYSFSFATSPVPEPASLALLGLGTLALLGRRRK